MPEDRHGLYTLRVLALLNGITYKAARHRLQRGLYTPAACDIRTRAYLFRVGR